MALRIVFVSEFFPPHTMGGGEQSAFLLAKGLAKSGVRVDVLTSRVKGLAEQEIIDRVHVHRRLRTGVSSATALGNMGRLRFTRSILRELPRFLNEHPADIVHAMNITSMPGVAAARIPKNIRRVAHINSPLAFCPKGTKIRSRKECAIKCTYWKCLFPIVFTGEEVGRLNNPFIRFNPIAHFLIWNRWRAIRNALTRFDYYFPISNYMAYWLRKYGVPQKKMIVLPNIVEFKAFLSAKKPEAQQKQDIPRILYLGGYTKMKGADVLFDALQPLYKDGWRFEAHFYGPKGPLRAKLVREAKRTNWLHVHNTVPFHKIPALYASHDIVVFPSRVPEAFGRVALEAMAAGKPIVASAIGGLTDIIEDGKTGLLVPPGNIEELTTALAHVLGHADLRARLAQAGRKRYQTRFSEERIIQKALTAYRHLPRNL